MTTDAFPSAGTGLRRALVRHVALTLLIAVLTSMLVTAGVALFAQRDAYRSAEQVARQVGAAVIVPLSHHDVGAPIGGADRADLARDLAPFLTSGMVRRVKVWTVRGDVARIAYSDEPRVEGAIDRTTSPDTARRLAAGEVLAQPVPDDAEHRFETPPAGALLEVFTAFRDAAGGASRLEVYVPVDEWGTAWRSATTTLPIVLGGLLVVAVATLPLSVALGRRAEHERSEQRAVRQYGLAAAETSRRELARRLHDGVIPDLAGAGVLLDAVRAEESGTGGPASRELLDNAHALLTGEVRELRSLLDEMVPPDPSTGDLGDALRELAARLGARDRPGPEVTVQTALPAGAGRGAAVLLHRVAGELLRNAFRHAGAGRVTVVVTSGGGRVTMTVSDDGRGFDPGVRRAGHVGLPLVRRALDDHGGSLDVASTPGGGTVVTASVPANVSPWPLRQLSSEPY